MVSETFLVAWRRLDEVPADARPWLIGVARNVRLNAQRTARRQQAVAVRLAGSAAEVAVPGSPHEEAVRTALDKLSAGDREVLLLSAWDDLGRSAIADVLGCTKANVSLRLHRARRRFGVALAGAQTSSPATPSFITGGHSDVR